VISIRSKECASRGYNYLPMGQDCLDLSCQLDLVSCVTKIQFECDDYEESLRGNSFDSFDVSLTPPQ
jgi:hypothetical protein